MAGTLNVDTIADNAGTGPVTLTKQAAAKAFHGYGNQTTGALDANSATLNISSYEDTATGRSRLNITSAFDAQVGPAILGSTQIYDYGHYMVSSSKYEVGATGSNNSYADGKTHGVVFGDLA